MRIHGGRLLKDKRNQGQVADQADEQGWKGMGWDFCWKRAAEEDAQKGADLDDPEQVGDREDQGDEGHVESRLSPS